MKYKATLQTDFVENRKKLKSYLHSILTDQEYEDANLDYGIDYCDYPNVEFVIEHLFLFGDISRKQFQMALNLFYDYN